MPVQHIKTDGIGDFTGTVTVFDSRASTTTVAATNLVRPSDWNSNHQMVLNASGNTLGSSQVTGTDLVWVGGSNITLSLDTANSKVNVIGAVPMSSWAPFEVPGIASTTMSVGTATNATVSFWPVTLDNYLAAGALNVVFSLNWISSNTSSGRASFGLHAGLYSRGTGANSTTLGSIDTVSFTMGMTVSSSSVTVSYPAATDYATYTYSSSSSIGLALSSLFTGLKVFAFPIGQTLTPGVYWIAMLGTNSTTSNNHGWSASLVGASSAALTALAPLNRHTSDFTSGTGFAIGGGIGGPWGFGHGSWTSANQTNLPVSVAISAMSAVTAAPIMPFLKFWST